MADEIMVRPPLLQRLALRVRSMVLPWSFGDIGAGSAGRQEALATFDKKHALSAMAAFPAVWACAQAISTDLAKLPIRIRESDDPRAGLVESHPFLDLLKRPSLSTSERMLRRQLYTDEALTGEAYTWLHKRQADALRRLHPRHVRPLADRFGDVPTFLYGDLEIQSRNVAWVRGPSWDDDISANRAESPVRPLNSDLVASQNALAHAAKASQHGRPDFLFSAPADSPLLAESAMQKVISKYEEMMNEGKRAFFSAGGLEAKQLTWSLRDLEYGSIIEGLWRASMVVFGVPAVRLGLPNANYGEAKVQMRMYWESLLSRASAFDDAWTLLARSMDPQGRRVAVFHDQSDIEALQNTRTDRQQRAAIWVTTFNAEPAEAAAYEGFNNAPVGDPMDAPAVPRRPARDPNELQEDRE